MDKAKISDPCDKSCKSFCERCFCEYCVEYNIKYDIILSRNPKWLTISPRYSDKDPTIDYIDWLDDIEELLKCSSHLLGVVEFANDRMHFHIMYDCTDPIKSYRVVNKFRADCMVKIYNGGPEKGLHYLFKDIEESKTLIPTVSTIFTDDMLDDRKKERKKQARLRLITQSLLERKKEIPEWMLKKSE